MIRNRIKAIELKRAVKIRPTGYFQVIESNKDLNKAKHLIDEARAKYPGYSIPLFRVFAAAEQ
jgi:hypothetical protein